MWDEISCSDINAQKGKSAVVRSKLDLSVEAAPDAVDIKALHFSTGKTNLQASGSLTHFAQPQWKLSANGPVELAELTGLGVVDGFRRGSVDLAAHGPGRRGQRLHDRRQGQGDQHQLCH